MNRARFAVFMVLAVALLRICGGHKETAGERKEGAAAGQQSPGISQGHPFASSGHAPGSESPLRSPRAASPQDEHRSRTPREALDSAPGDGTQRAARHPQSQQQRTRVNRRQSSKISPASRRLVGPNVCGGQQCCSGWAVAPGTNRCIKPDCQPPCQNRGSCSRPHTCVCRSGFQGPRCEDVAPEQVYIRERGALRRVEPGSNPFQRDRPQRRPSERFGTDTTKAQTPRPPTSKLSVHSGSQMRQDPPDSSPQRSGTSRTVKRYPSSSGPITSNALPSTNGHAHSVDHSWYSHRNAHSNTPSGPSSGSHRQTNNRQLQGQFNNVLLPAGANLTSNLDRIKIVFTPMMCNRVCNGGRCYNNCEKGDITTVYSETSQQQQQQQQPKSQGFRLFFCQIPCLNGGRCIGRDLCWCPSNSTGKFCHLAAPPHAKPTSHSRTLTARHGAKSPSHSTYTLPLSNQQVSLHPSLVNVHIQHPPEAEVQIHQVARVQPGQRLANTEGGHSVQQRSQPGNGHEHASEHGSRQFPSSESGHVTTHSWQNEIVGRCFQETVDGQCGKPLPGLTKQDDCCGSIGASWGLNKCQKCPTKPGYAVIANGQVQCPKGFKRMNASHCQDINECLLPGICKNAECVNTKGSYRCTCKPGYMLDAARSHCVSDKAVSEERASCYRSIASGLCSLPLANHLTKQICCCSRVGKAWGHGCDRCPLPGSDHFKEICPAGHGYTYSRSDVQISVRQLEDDELQSTGVSLEEQYPQFPSSQPSLLFPSEPQRPSYPQTPHVPQSPDYHDTPRIPQHPLSPQHPSYSENEAAEGREGEESLLPPALVTDSPLKRPDSPSINLTPDLKKINPKVSPTDINKCASVPSVCGRGKCISVQTGHTCLCDPGFKLSALQTNCIDVNECDENPCEGKGLCINSYGSYSCQCHSGYSQVITQNRKFCQDINECSMPNKCQNGKCVNTEGSYTCECNSGFAKSWRGQCEDVDECKDPSSCPSRICINSLGSFQCQACSPGFRLASERCVDVNECLNQTVCGRGRCVNTQGFYRCNCFHGYKLSPDNVCQDVDECVLPEVCNHGHCVNLDGTHECTCNHGYQVTPDRKSCEDVNECATGNACPLGICINTAGSYTCQNCRPGFGPSADRLRCEDVDECNNDNVCVHGQCINTNGSFLCLCEAGFKFSVDTVDCEDQDECKEFGSPVCGTWRCENTIGSYKCFMRCQSGSLEENCDINECDNETICGEHGFCENTDGSFRCQCDRGYTNPAGDVTQCIDVNECEMSSALCGEAQCENYDGSFLCICPNDNEEFDPITNQCRSMALIDTKPVYPLTPSTDERKECYYNLNDANYCNNVLSRNTTKQECCCTAGAGWGDNCEIHACPLPGKDDYNQLCPHGSGVLPLPDLSRQSHGDRLPYIDANECEMFGSEICKNGQCSNIFSTYTCFCRSGFYYDNIRLECVDYDECQFGNTCENGACVNTAGSFNCFCSPPLVLDSSQRRCISLNSTEETFEYGQDVHENICWRRLEGDNMCADPHPERRTTYSECCCLHGIAWGDQCAFCPRKDSADYATMCNLPWEGGSDSLRDQIGFEYGPEGPDDHSVPFLPPYWDNYGGPAGTYDIPESIALFNDRDYNVQQPPVRVPIVQPGSHPHSVNPHSEHHNAFEGLQAEECGILNGCENGRCVRVQEGYTCDCFDGYELDLSKMACVDINECEDISDKVPLCHNGQCTNTEGSYKCTCLVGFVASAKPHTCIPTIPDPKLRDSEN